MYYVYLLKCADDTIYTGITTDVTRRFEEHKNGIGSKYTHAKRAVEIIYTEEYKDRSSASQREAEIKKFPRQKKLGLINIRARMSI